MEKHLRLIAFLSIIVAMTFMAVSATSALAANRGLAVPSSQLPNELKRADIKDFYNGSGAREAGVIQTIVGHMIVAREDLRTAYYAAPGDKLFEKDVLFTLKGSKSRFKLIGEDVVMMGENSRLGIKSFQENAQKGTKSSVFTMSKGKAMFYALRLFKHSSNSMVVESPTAICGVRGTKWGVEVEEMPGKEMASRPIHVADTSDLGFRLLAQANPPSLPLFQTTILCFSGTVFTGSTAPPPPGAPPPPVITLSQGQMTTVGSGAPPAPPSITPLSLANSFTAGTFAPPPGDSGAPPPPPPPATTTTIPVTTIPGTTIPDTSNVTQQQNQVIQSRPATHEGFFTGMMSSDGLYSDTLLSDTPQNFDSGTAVALGTQIGSTGSTPTLYIAGLATSGAAMTGLILSPDDFWTGSMPVAKTELGYNTYMEWGYWTQPEIITTRQSNYNFNNKNYYVWGDKTTNMPATISGTYSGNAYGTVWSSSGGEDKTGTFSMYVSYTGGSGTIRDFNILTGSEVDKTGITGGSGSIKGGNYSVTGTGWVKGLQAQQYPLDPVATASGAFYGPTAQYTGGVWKATASGDVGSMTASGVFVGKKQ